MSNNMRIHDHTDVMYTGTEETAAATASGKKVSQTTPTADTPVMQPATKTAAGNEGNVSLPPPAQTQINVQALKGAVAACPAMGASLLALLQQSLSELVQDNREIAYKAKMDAADMTEQQADTIKEKATVQLALGIVQGAIQIGAGVFQTVSSSMDLAKSMKPGETAVQTDQLNPEVNPAGTTASQPDAAPTAPQTQTQSSVQDVTSEVEVPQSTHAPEGQSEPVSGSQTAPARTDSEQVQADTDIAETEAEEATAQAAADKSKADDTMASATLQARTARTQAIGQIISTVAQLTGSGNEYAGAHYDSELKKEEAGQQKVQAYAEQIESITQSLQDSVQKAIETMSAVSQSMVEANRRILG